MVSKKPTKVFDANARLGIGFANYSGVNSYFSSVNIGTRQNKYYVMGTASFDKVDDFVLSKSFNINKIQSDIVRNRSASFDSKLSAKFGYIPNKTDEYSFDILR